MEKKIFGIILLVVMSVSAVQLGAYCENTTAFSKYFDAAQTDYEQGQYSSAITNYRQALRINYLDTSARIGLINSYLARAGYYANQEKKFDKAANDFRSALFYLKIYPTKEQAVQNSAGSITSAMENLNQCLKVIGFDRTAESRFKAAENLRISGNLAASAYEFSQAATNEKYSISANSNIADLLKILGNEPRSADYYKIALDQNPNDSILRMKYARTLDKIGNYDDALIQYNSALANSKGDMEVLYALERIYLKKLAQTPSDAEMNANIGAIKQAQGDFESALNYYGKAEQINPENINTRLNVGTLFQQKKDYIKALKSYDSVLTLYPDNVQANLYKAQVLAEMGDNEKAVECYKKVLSVEPSNDIAKSELSKVMQSTLSTDEYIGYLSQNANDRTMQNVLYDYAYKLHKENKLEDAIKAYKAVINSNSSNIDAYVNMAICYAAQNNYKMAESVLNNAKAKFPTNNLILKTLQDVRNDQTSVSLADASKSYENKDYQKAIEQYKLVNPATEDSLLGIAASYQGLNDFTKAIEYYQKAEKLSPKNSEIPYYIGYLYSEQQKWSDAESYLKKSIQIDPNSQAKNLLPYVVENHVNSTLQVGIDLYEKGDFESALTKFNDILRNDAKNAYAYYYRGLIYDEQKKFQQAINDYLEALKYTNELPIVNYMLAVDYDGLENYKSAFKYYTNFVSSYKSEDEYLSYAKSRIEELKAYAN